MFPTVRAAASGLEPSQHYFVLMDIILAEENRWENLENLESARG